MSENCKTCGKPMHKFHDCILNPVATPLTGAQLAMQAREILVERIVYEAQRGAAFDIDPVEILREATEKVNSDAMVIVNRMPEAV